MFPRVVPVTEFPGLAIEAVTVFVTPAASVTVNVNSSSEPVSN
jgi:hypothetical protein